MICLIIMRHREVFVLIFIICCFNEAREGFTINEDYFEKNLVGKEIEPVKAKWKDTRNENNILKSKIEILGEIFRKRVDHLKADNKIELIFLVDSSSSVGEENFKNELKFVQKLISDITVSPTDTRVAVATFATSVETHVNHLDNNTQEHEKCTLLHKELPNIKYSGGNTFTLGALLEAQVILQNARPDAKLALFLITDGFSNNGYPVPVARQLQQSGVTIFTFGIRNGNIEELHEMSSKPAEEHSFLLESFAEFEALARRALHEDLKSGSYLSLKNVKLCNELCDLKNGTEFQGCCNEKSQCSCGTLSGHFVCLCPAGYYGSGLIGEECLPCPNGTYHDGLTPGDETVCRPCPDSNQETVKYPATSKNDCKCKEGFVPVGDKCQVITCPQLTPPINGYFVKKTCSNVLHAACGVRCNIGFDLSGSSVRLCQKNGTWSGTAPRCSPKSCNKLKPVPNAEIICTNEDENFEAVLRYDSDGNKTKQLIKHLDFGANDEIKTPKPYFNKSTDFNEDLNFTIDTECKFSCGVGFSLVGSKVRSCLPVTRWGGLQTTCKAITCSSLPILKNGFLTPENCTAKGLKHKYDAHCKVACKDGYQLKGPEERNCTGKYGTWTGKNIPSKCADIEPPRFKCLDNITLTTDDGLPYATANLSLPKAVDNSESEPIMWTKPPFDGNNPLKLNIGTTEVGIFAMDDSNNNASCSFFIEVKDTEHPKFQNCDTSYTYYLSNLNSTSDIKWEEPTVTDNSDQSIGMRKNHSELVMGTTTINYTATDISKNVAECAINITILENPCSERPTSTNSDWNCSVDDSNTTICNVSCQQGFRFFSWQTYEDSNFTLTCVYKDDVAIWNPEYLKKDFDTFPECLPSIEPVKATSTEEIVTEGDADICNSLDDLSATITNDVKSILGDDEAEIVISSRCENASESEKEETTNLIQERKKREVPRKKIHIDVSLIGSTSKYQSTNDMINHLKTSGEKIQNEYTKRNHFKSNGKKVKINKIGTKKAASIVCNNGTIVSNRGDYCIKCPKGTFHNITYSTCDPCPIGQYQDSDGQMNCLQCHEGFSTRKQHSRFFKHCKKICPSGSFGRKSDHNQLTLQPCKLCDLGHYQPLKGQSSCLKCSFENETTLKRGSLHQDECIQFEVITNPCLRSPCKNNGTCVLDNSFATCTCLSGFAGSFCEIALNPCESSPCYNGQCVRMGFDGFRCDCTSSYEGEFCQVETNECESSPCKNGAECVDVFDGYACNCATGFTGENCGENINECEILQPCQNDGFCVNGVNGYNCTCSENFFGTHCEQFYECDSEIDDECGDNSVSLDPCYSVVCPGNKECRITGDKSQCVCRKGFRGEGCTEAIDTDVVLNFPKCSVTEYLTVSLPTQELTEISFCVWLQTTDSFNYGTLLSYATHDDDNAFTFTDYNGFVLYVQKKRVITDITANDGFWHFICVTWQSQGGNWRIYMDGEERASGTGLSDHLPIPGGGKLIVGQEQDRFGGGFNEVESFVGKMAYLEVWDRVLGPSEIEIMNQECRQFNGNLFTWLDFIENMHGNIQKTPSTFCKDCTSKLYLFRGIITTETRNNYTVAKYECNEGFFIKFNNEDEQEDYGNRIWYRRCLKHGDWEPDAPKCSRVKCGFPGYFPHGHIAGNSYYYQDVISYRCTVGYQLQGDSTRVCQANGLWSGHKPYCQGGSISSCKPLIAPRHGSMFIYFHRENSHDVHFPATGDKVEFTCDKGFNLIGSNILSCTDEGIWDFDEPICEEIKCQISDEISLLLDEEPEKKFYSINEDITITCPYINIQQKITCQPSGYFNFTVNTCNVRCFDRPNPPEHGYIVQDGRGSPQYESGELVLVNCNHGYKLLGDNYFNCSENNLWEQRRKTTCEPAQCGTPLPIPNAQSFPEKSYFYGDRIVYKCLSGYQKYGDVSIRCEAEARWSRIQGRCIKISCRKPKLPDGMIAIGNSHSYDDVLEIICPNGLKLPDNAANYIKCQTNGLWSDIPQCV